MSAKGKQYWVVRVANTFLTIKNDGIAKLSQKYLQNRVDGLINFF